MVGNAVTFIVSDVYDPDGEVSATLVGRREAESEVELAEMTADGASFVTQYSFADHGGWLLVARLSQGGASVLTSTVFRHVDADGVYVYGVIWQPPDAAEVELKNGSLEAQDVSGWTVGDADSPSAYSIPDGTTLGSKEHLCISAAEMGIELAEDSVICLRDQTGAQIDTWGE